MDSLVLARNKKRRLTQDQTKLARYPIAPEPIFLSVVEKIWSQTRKASFWVRGMDSSVLARNKKRRLTQDQTKLAHYRARHGLFGPRPQQKTTPDAGSDQIGPLPK